MHLQQMLRQDRVTLKKDTLFRTDSTHTCTCTHSYTSEAAQATEPARDGEGEFYFQEVFCAYLRGETIEREGGQEEKEGQRLRE